MPDSSDAIDLAQSLFAALKEQAADNPDRNVIIGVAKVAADGIRYNLSGAKGADGKINYAFLDPTGQQTSEQMEAALKETTSKAEINEARQLLARLQTDDTLRYDQVKSLAESIRTDVDLAKTADGTSSAALDVTGKHSALEMEQFLRDTIARKEITIVLEEMRRLQRNDAEGYGNYRGAMAATVGQHLQEIGSQLAPAGEHPQTAQEKDGTQRGAKLGLGIARARDEFIRIQRSPEHNHANPAISMPHVTDELKNIQAQLTPPGNQPSTVRKL